MNVIELCAGAGGQALGLHHAGYKHHTMLEIDEYAHETLVYNNKAHQLGWGQILNEDIKSFSTTAARKLRGEIDLVAGGVPCPPFSKAGLQLGNKDERDLFPTALDIVRDVRPSAVMLENVPGLAQQKFVEYRNKITTRLKRLGYISEWKVLNSSDFGVSQLRPRIVLVALRAPIFEFFSWPEPYKEQAPTVGEALIDIMASRGWERAEEWMRRANKIAPTIVGGSKKHGGPDLGPSRAKKQWYLLGVNAHRVGNEDEIPGPGFEGVRMRTGKIRSGFEAMPLLTLRMVARLQGFPDYWVFRGSKTHAYRQVGNAFPPPVAEAVGRKIHRALMRAAELGLMEIAA